MLKKLACPGLPSKALYRYMQPPELQHARPCLLEASILTQFVNGLMLLPDKVFFMPPRFHLWPSGWACWKKYVVQD